MKIHRELTVPCSQAQFRTLASQITGDLTCGWTRNLPAEKRLADDEFICFACDRRGERREAEVWLNYSAERKHAWIANVIPIGANALTIDEYNSVVESFFEECLVSGCSALGLTPALADSEVGPSHWGLKPATVSLLQSFSNLANKSTGSSHPRDRERWFDFLTAIYKDNSDLDATMLGRMLVENYGWSATEASRLREEYEFAIDLLRQYDRVGVHR